MDNNAAITGEVSIRGQIKPVGGITAKIEAARAAGANKVIIPVDNWQEILAHYSGIQVVPAGTLEQVFKEVLVRSGRPDIELASLRPAASS